MNKNETKETLDLLKDIQRLRRERKKALEKEIELAKGRIALGWEPRIDYLVTCRKQMLYREWSRKKYGQMDFSKTDCYQTMGKRRKDLNPEELRDYNKMKQRERRAKRTLGQKEQN